MTIATIIQSIQSPTSQHTDAIIAHAAELPCVRVIEDAIGHGRHTSANLRMVATDVWVDFTIGRDAALAKIARITVRLNDDGFAAFVTYSWCTYSNVDVHLYGMPDQIMPDAIAAIAALPPRIDGGAPPPSAPVAFDPIPLAYAA